MLGAEGSRPLEIKRYVGFHIPLDEIKYDLSRKACRQQCSEFSPNTKGSLEETPYTILILNFHVSKIKARILSACNPLPQKGRHCSAG